MKHIYLGGKIFGHEILKINETYIKSRVLAGLTNVASFSLQAAIPTKASAPHILMSGLQKLLGLKLHTGIDAGALKAGAGGAPSAHVAEEKGKDAGKDDKKAGGKDDKKAPAKDDKKGGKDDKKGKKEPEPEPEDNPEGDDYGGGMGDLFG